MKSYGQVGPRKTSSSHPKGTGAVTMSHGYHYIYNSKCGCVFHSHGAICKTFKMSNTILTSSTEQLEAAYKQLIKGLNTL